MIYSKDSMQAEAQTKQITVNIARKKLGRVAGDIAMKLMGKDTPAYTPNKVANINVIVEGVNDLDLGDKKLGEKEYQRYSGYPGGRKVFTMADVVAKKGAAEVLKKAVYGMLPANKLRKQRMKNLIIK